MLGQKRSGSPAEEIQCTNYLTNHLCRCISQLHVYLLFLYWGLPDHCKCCKFLPLTVLWATVAPCAGSGNGLAQQLLQLFFTFIFPKARHPFHNFPEEEDIKDFSLSSGQMNDTWPSADDFRNVKQKMHQLRLHACSLTEREDPLYRRTRAQDKQRSALEESREHLGRSNHMW